MTNDQIDHFKTILRKDGKTLADLRQLPVMPQAELDASLDRLSRLTATMGGRDERDARIAKLEADVDRFEKKVADCVDLITLMLRNEDLLSMRYQNIKTERDMLRAQVQELLRVAAEPEATVEPDPVFAAIETHQKQGVR